jgi:Mg-chelatase subunit ChlD
MKIEDPPKVKLTCYRKKDSKIVECVVEVSTKSKVEKIDEIFEVKKPGLEIAVVFDVSYSMENSMESAKKGLNYLINNLNPRDVIHLITFSNRARIVFENKTKLDKEELKKLIDSLEVTGCTNMMSGVDVAKQILLKSLNEHKKKHMFVFTDGVINKGIQDKHIIYEEIKTLRENKILVSTFGYGKDYDEDLMTNISRYGEGCFKYIRNSNELEYTLQEVFDLQSRISYSAVQIYLKPCQSKDKVLKVNGYNLIDGNKIILGSLYYGKDIRNFGFQMELNKINPELGLIEIVFEGMHTSLEKCVKFTFLFGQNIIEIDNSEDVSKAIYVLTCYAEDYNRKISPHLTKDDEGVIKLLKEYISKIVKFRDVCPTINSACKSFEIAINSIKEKDYDTAIKELWTLSHKHSQGSFYSPNPPKKKNKKSRLDEFYDIMGIRKVV